MKNITEWVAIEVVVFILGFGGLALCAILCGAAFCWYVLERETAWQCCGFTLPVRRENRRNIKIQIEI